MPSPSQIAWAKFRVTIAVIVSLAILSVIVYLLTGGTLFTAKATVFAFIPDATALTTASLVRVNGVDVGRVQSVALSGSDEKNRVIRVTLEIEEQHMSDIPVDSTLQISADNLVGDKFVDIARGRSNTLIRRNGEIAFKGQPELLKTLDLQQFDQQIRAVQSTLDDIEQGRSELGQFVQGDQTYKDLLRWLGDVQKGLLATARTTDKIGSVIYTGRLMTQIEQPIVQLDATLARIQAGEGPLGQMLQSDAQYSQLRDLLADLRKTVATVESNPLLQSDELYTSWNRMLRSVIAGVDEFAANPLLGTASDYENWVGAEKQLGAGLHDFQQNPQKYLRFKLF